MVDRDLLLWMLEICDMDCLSLSVVRMYESRVSAQFCTYPKRLLKHSYLSSSGALDLPQPVIFGPLSQVNGTV